MLKKEFLDKVAENAGLYKYQAYMFWNCSIIRFVTNSYTLILI